MNNNDEPYCIVPFSNNSNLTAMVSIQDYTLVMKHKWAFYEFQDKTRDRMFVMSSIDKKLIHMHHLILGKPTSKFEIIIHKNNNKLDNRRCNLIITERKHSLNNKRTCIKPIEDTKICKTHPVLSNYVANIDGDVLRKSDHIQILGSNNNAGYNQITLTTTDGNKYYKMRHLFVYECFYGLVPDGHEIDHIDNNKNNNKLSNLQCLSVKEHHIKTAKNNPEKGKKVKEKLSKPIIAINLKTLESFY
jgi:hypothetical protein